MINNYTNSVEFHKKQAQHQQKFTKCNVPKSTWNVATVPMLDYVNPFQVTKVKEFIPLKSRSCAHMTKEALFAIVQFPEWAYNLPEWGQELCVIWLEMGTCTRKTCRLAHGQGELTETALMYYGNRFKHSSCRTFTKTKYCVWGSACLFKHESREIH